MVHLIATTLCASRRASHALARCTTIAVVASMALFAGCAAAPPTGWQAGGTPLTVPHARWVNGNLAIDIDAAGRVRLGDRHLLTIDRAGRAYDPYGRPIALLDDKGYLFGPDDEPMGWVGAGQAMRPGDEEPWLVLTASGELVRIDDGESHPFGVWLGCGRGPRSLQACTLVAHLLASELLHPIAPASGMSVGVGVGVGVWP